MPLTNMDHQNAVEVVAKEIYERNGSRLRFNKYKESGMRNEYLQRMIDADSAHCEMLARFYIAALLNNGFKLERK